MFNGYFFVVFFCRTFSLFAQASTMITVFFIGMLTHLEKVPWANMNRSKHCFKGCP